MFYQGQIHRKVGENNLWEVIEPSRAPSHQGEWYLAKLGGNDVKLVSKPLLDDLEDLSSDTSKAIDTYFYSHFAYLLMELKLLTICEVIQANCRPPGSVAR